MEMGLWRKPCTASVCANNGDTSRRRHLEVLSVLLPAGAASFILSAFHHSFVCRVVAAVVCFELAVCAAVVEFYFFVLFRAAVVAFS